MGYKKDINLFKAAGGAVGKAKKMPLTKKLLILMVIVVFVVGAVIGFLTYLQLNQTKELKKLKDQHDAYEYTQKATQSLLNEYNSVLTSKKTLSFIEYYTEVKSNMFSAVTESELKSIKDYLEVYDYSTDYDFKAVSNEIRKKVLLAPYQIDSNQDDAAILSENYKVMYSALSNMIDYQSLFEDLPEQNDSGIWYSYYRGQFFAVVQGGPDVSTLLQGLTDKDALGANPFMSLNLTTIGGGEVFSEAYGMSVQVDGVDYSLLCITRRTTIERLFDVIESRIKIAIENEYDQTGVDYAYQIGKLSINTEANTITFDISVTQNEVFGLEDVVLAIDESPFFEAGKDLVFDYKDGEPTQAAELVFTIENYALNIMEDTATRLFAFGEEEE